MSEHRRRVRRSQMPQWQQDQHDENALSEEFENHTQETREPSDKNAYFSAPAAYGEEDDNDYWGEDPVAKAPKNAAPAPKKRKSNENLILTAILLIALSVAILSGVLIYFQSQTAQEEANAAPTAVPYDASQPFLPSDITDEQMTHIEENGGSFALMDYEIGPHGIQIGHSLDTLLSRFPLTYAQDAADGYVWDENTQNMSGLTYNYLETDQQVIYAARVFYREGEKIVLPPSATMTISSDQILVMMTAPLTPYPEGTAENYLAYPHVYCKLTINPETSKITRIVLGKSE